MSIESAKKLAEETVKKLIDELLLPRKKPLNAKELTSITRDIIKYAYEHCDAEYNEHLYLELATNLHPKALKKNHPTLPGLFTPSLIAIPCQANKHYFNKQPVNARLQEELAKLKEKYKSADKEAQKGTVWNFLKYAFKSPSKILSFLNNSWYKNPFIDEMKRYFFPVNIIVTLISWGLIIALGTVDMVRAVVSSAAQNIISAYQWLARGIVNLVTGFLYKKAVTDYLNDSGLKKEFIDELKRAQIEAQLDGSKQTPYRIMAERQLNDLDSDEFLKLLAAKRAEGAFNSVYNSKFYMSLYHDQMEKQIPSLARLKLMFSAYFSALTKPLAEIEGTGSKFLSVAVIRPLQAISALVMIPVLSIIELTQLAKNVVNYTAKAVEAAAYYASLTVLIMPLKAYDLVANIFNSCFGKDKTAKSEVVPSNAYGLTELASTPESKNAFAQSKPQDTKEPGHFSSPLKKPSKKPESDDKSHADVHITSLSMAH